MKKQCHEEPCCVSPVAPELESAQEELLSLLSAWSHGERWRPGQDADLDIVWLLAAQHGLSGFIGAIGEPEHCGAMLKAGREAYFSIVVSHKQCLAICRHLQRQARAFNIPLAFFNGPVLAEDAYSDCGLRPYAELDVLVGCREDACRLIETCGLAYRDTPAGWSRRTSAPGRIHAEAEGSQVCFRYPLSSPCDPLFDLLQRHGNRILRVPSGDDVLAAPDPELHLLLLLQHMARHLCTRLLWYIDLVALWRRYRFEIDPDFLLAELDILQCRNIAAAISHFCSNFIDCDFPLLPEGPSGWNSSFQRAITSPGYLSETLLVAIGAGKQRARLLPLTRYFLITDPREQVMGGKPAAARWLAARTVQAIGSDSEVLRRLLEWMFRLTCPILSTTYHAWFTKTTPPAVHMK